MIEWKSAFHLLERCSIVDRLDELLVLTTILDAGSLAAAARRLRRSPPAMTRSLAALEARVGARLVQRTPRRLTPTAAGRRLASCASQLLADYEQATRTGKAKQDAPLDGVLRVTAPSLFGRWHIAPLVWSFLDAHPGIRAELVLTNRNLDLVEEGLDVAVRIGPLTESGLVARRVGQVRWVLFASPDYVTRRGRPRTPRDLIKHDIVYEFASAFSNGMALSHLRTWQSCAHHSEVHGHRNRGCACCCESWTRNWPDTFLSSGGRFRVGSPGTATGRIRAPSVARSSRCSDHAIHAASGSCVS